MVFIKATSLEAALPWHKHFIGGPPQKTLKPHLVSEMYNFVQCHAVVHLFLERNVFGHIHTMCYETALLIPPLRKRGFIYRDF